MAPVVREIPSTLTPLRALAAVENEPGTVFLETGGPASAEREWTFLAFDPLWRLTLADGVLRRDGPAGGGGSDDTGRPRATPLPAEPPLASLRRAWPRRLVLDPDPGIPLAGGLLGYLSYDFKDALHPYPRRARRESVHPDLSLGYYDVVWAWERRSGAGCVVATGPDGAAPGARAAAARARLDSQWERMVRGGPGSGGCRAGAGGTPALGASGRRIVSDFTRDSYRGAVRRALEHIAAGNIYQANLSQRFLVTPAPAAAALFRRLREAAPAPFAAFLSLPGGGIVSSSPERFFRIDGDRIETWPIKGTRPRGRTAAEDEALAGELLASAKDRAENVMIVDLERNDLGRVSAVGSVAVPELCEIRSFSNVHHLVSRVTGRLRPEVAPADILAALFPGGSITGAPKIRAVGVIDELEPVRRGVFTGAIGYWDLRGGCDFSIAIRTLSVEPGAVSFHVGGGIVADSDPDAEYEETLTKAAGMMDALGVRWEG